MTTATIQVRELIRSFGDKEFSSADIFIRARCQKRTNVFSALRNMTRWGELQIVRKVPNGHGTGSSMNIYLAVNIAPEGQKPKRKLSKQYEKRVKPVPVKTYSVWEEVWPDLYQIPKFERQSVFFTNQCIG